MCAGCGFGVPACMVDGSCSYHLQNVKNIVLAASPVIAGAGVLFQTKLVKKRDKKIKKTNKTDEKA